MTSVSEEFARLLHETARSWRHEFDHRLRPLGLSQAKGLALLHLARASVLTQKDLAARLGIEGPTLVGILDRLNADGWIERHEAPHDRRSKTVRLTKSAQPVLKEINRIAAELRTELLQDINADALKSCNDILKQVQRRAAALAHPEDDGNDA
ncbi:MAG: MarR family winged helix-turn-helix transcriptional regulator [Acidiferrobacteraceae bacterium]